MEETKGVPTKVVAGVSRCFLLGVTWRRKGVIIGIGVEG